MAELKELFDQVIKKLKTTRSPKGVSVLLNEFIEKLPSGEIKKFFFNLSELVVMPDSEEPTFEELKEVLKQVEQVKSKVNEAPQEVPTKIIEAYKNCVDFAISGIKKLIEIVDPQKNKWKTP